MKRDAKNAMAADTVNANYPNNMTGMPVRVRFAEALEPLVFFGKKRTNWRLRDDKNLKTGEVAIFGKGPERLPIARARLTNVTGERPGGLNEEGGLGEGAYEDGQKSYFLHYQREVSKRRLLKPFVLNF